MTEIVNFFLNYLNAFAEMVSLPVFIAVGAVVEEIIAIIPSPFVPLTAGSLALAQGKTISYLLFLGVVGAIAKTLASLLTYWVADKLEDFLTKGKFSKFLGLESEDIERYGRMFSEGAKDEIVLIILRALPFVPSLPVSIVAGLIKVDIKSFAWSTAVGIFIRNMFYLLISFYGLQQFESVLNSFDTMSLVLEVAVVLIFAIAAFLILRKNWDKWLEAIKNKKSGKTKAKKK
jgi:membrane protein DedA with SNARE-associated domain